MIISKQKEFKNVLHILKEHNIFIIGCGKCATKLRVGGEKEVLEMKKKLASAGKNITGWTVLNSACSISSWKEFISQNPAVKKADALLVMSCGGGVSVISSCTQLQVYPALDTESLGGVYNDRVMEEQCGMCGECNIWEYGGICPYIQCAKSLLNGPCGGARNGKCEVNELPCAWEEIFERLKKTGNLEYLKKTHAPKDHAKKQRGRSS